ncbi:2Fe-2S iron-sulfur cluster-binding protein [Hydrogenophaga sp. 5NK40-0174]|uniref:2Fe-2S iron-sulfur cluster-binding protein n=1 Tax=Hydrogenophaga sp. 5NK40-0174 TaxID=3127649 RepID=UPI003108F154
MTAIPSFAALAAKGSTSSRIHQIHIDDTQEVYPCSEKDNALNALARSGRKGIPVGCRGGGCGVCKVAVLAGSFRSRVMSRSHVSADEEANGVVLACCIQPTSDLTLSVIGKLRKAVTRPRS